MPIVLRVNNLSIESTYFDSKRLPFYVAKVLS